MTEDSDDNGLPVYTFPLLNIKSQLLHNQNFYLLNTFYDLCELK